MIVRNLSFFVLRSYTIQKRLYWFAPQSEVNYCVCAMEKSKQKHETENFAGLHNHSLVNYRLGHGAMANGLCARLRGIERSRSKPCRDLCDVFLCKTLIFHSSFLHQGVQMGTDSLLGVNFNEDVKFYLLILPKKGVTLISSLVYVPAWHRGGSNSNLECWYLWRKENW